MKELDRLDILYLIIFFLIVIIRKFFTRKHGGEKINTGIENLMENILLGFIGISMIAPLIFFFTGWIDFANYEVPISMRYTGLVLFAFSGWFIWKSHFDLGKGWTFSLETHDSHKLVTHGIYRLMRHPMYAAHLVWAIANVLIIPNWVAGPTFLFFSIILLVIRIPKEEKMMLNEFGNDYKVYMKRTGRVFPKIWKYK